MFDSSFLSFALGAEFAAVSATLQEEAVGSEALIFTPEIQSLRFYASRAQRETDRWTDGQTDR